MGEGKKPWDETWHAVTRERDGKLRCMGVRGGREEDAVVETDCGLYPPSVAQAHLIAAAPDLYRALAAVEWSGTIDGGLTCPTCEVTGGRHHESGCALNAALRKARGET